MRSALLVVLPMYMGVILLIIDDFGTEAGAPHVYGGDPHGAYCAPV